MTENEAIEIIEDVTWKDFGRHPDFPEAREKAIKALEEVQHWHTSEINPKIKNAFANTSTQICHNCDHKDEYIEELEAEVEEYSAIGTLEECRAAVEKQKAKKPMHVTNSYFGYQKHKEHVGYCPDCGHQVKEPYGCPNCLRKIDWSDEE